MAVPAASEVVVWVVVIGVNVPVPGGTAPPGGGGGAAVVPVGAPGGAGAEVVVEVVPAGGGAGGEPVVVAAEVVGGGGGGEEEVVTGGGGLDEPGGSCLLFRWALRRTCWSAARAVVSCSAETKARVLSFMTNESGALSKGKRGKKKKCTQFLTP